LRPSVNVYKLETDYNFNISMFERLVNNDFESVMLHNQRRMRPEIAELPKQIYPKLTNDESVTKYPSVRGMSTNLFFMDHRFEEG
jgi:hypothetical protein